MHIRSDSSTWIYFGNRIASMRAEHAIASGFAIMGNLSTEMSVGFSSVMCLR